MAITMNNVEMTSSQFTELDIWMRNYAWNRAEYLNKIGISFMKDRPIKRNERGVYEQSGIIGFVSELQEQILSQVAKIMGLSTVEKESYPHMSTDIETILEIINDDIDGWEAGIDGQSLVVSRFFSSILDVWNQKMVGLLSTKDMFASCIIYENEIRLKTNNFEMHILIPSDKEAKGGSGAGLRWKKVNDYVAFIIPHKEMLSLYGLFKNMGNDVEEFALESGFIMKERDDESYTLFFDNFHLSVSGSELKELKTIFMETRSLYYKNIEKKFIIKIDCSSCNGEGCASCKNTGKCDFDNTCPTCKENEADRNIGECQKCFF